MTRIIIILITLIVLTGCSSIPPGVQAVRDFDVNRYQGRWYDGGIDVLNKGFDKQSSRWKQAKGRAYFVKDKTIGRLKVTFFWPFYGGYNIIALDKDNYSYAMVCGPNRSYLWILAREKTLNSSVVDSLLKTTESLGFKTDSLIFVEQNWE